MNRKSPPFKGRRRALGKMVKANLDANEAMVKALERNQEKPRDPEAQAAWKAKWHAAVQLSRAAVEDGSAQCPCGDKKYLSSFFTTFDDHNMYCSPCITAMQRLLCMDDPDGRDMDERYGEPGELWARINN